MSTEKSLLDLLVCPETHQKLAPADPTLLERLNASIAQGELKTHAGERVEGSIQEGLVREDGKALYRIEDGLPNMLIDERIDL